MGTRISKSKAGLIRRLVARGLGSVFISRRVGVSVDTVKWIESGGDCRIPWGGLNRCIACGAKVEGPCWECYVKSMMTGKLLGEECDGKELGVDLQGEHLERYNRVRGLSRIP